MSDLALKYRGRFFDIEIKNNDIVQDDGLETAVIISLFTDKRVGIEELPPLETDRAGWWGDMFADLENDEVGSKLWLLAREKQTSQTLTRVIQYCKEALQWLVDDDVAESFEVSASYPERERLSLEISIQKPQGKVSFKYILNWRAEASKGE
jgi:phage gp46-like protein